MKTLFDSQQSDSAPTSIANEAFEAGLFQEVLQGERLRVALLILIFGVASLIMGGIQLLLPDRLALLFHGHQIWLLLFLLGITVYETILWKYLSYVLHAGKREYIPAIHYLNVFIETSFPTVAIILVAQLSNPIHAILSPWSHLYFLFIVLSALRLDFKICLFTGFVVSTEYLAIALFYQKQLDITSEALLRDPQPYIIRAVILMLSGVLIGLVTLEIKKRILHLLDSQEEQRRIVEVFGQHVSPEVAKQMLDQNLTTQGELKEVCILFLDIRNFTKFSEKQSPEDVVLFLDQLFSFMIEIVNEHHGMINKFLGDGFMAVFGAPLDDDDKENHAVLAALEIINKVEQYSLSGIIHPTRIGIGIHSGKAVVGCVGSELRQEYTVIGDVVNLASRIEQLNKSFQSQLLISEHVWNAIAERFPHATPQGDVSVKGREQSVPIYKLA